MYQVIYDYPTVMYFKALRDLVETGDKVAPRGKLISELRPACFEFGNPYNRVTFLRGRRINPFFQIAESLWILSGRADVEFLLKFNENMKQFSDDGVWFNAPYGERMRLWNKNSLHGIIINPIDQLVDVYRKLSEDKDTRQAVIVLSNPMFDNSKYTINEKGKDISCNLVITFKIRHNKLNMTVFNRSNDLHWGVFGANLCQFSTIQECLMNWLKVSKYPELQMGTYNQITDSLHIYLDDYGSKITNEVLKEYKNKSVGESNVIWEFPNEPRMSFGVKQFDDFLNLFWYVINPQLMNDEVMQDNNKREEVFGKDGMFVDSYKKGQIDDYWYFAIQSMVVYRLVKLSKLVEALEYMTHMESCQWKVSMLYFLKKFVIKVIHAKPDEDLTAQRVSNLYLHNAKQLLSHMTNMNETSVLALEEYLRVEE